MAKELTQWLAKLGTEMLYIELERPWENVSFVGEFEISGNLCMRAEPSPVPFSVGEVTPADLWVDGTPREAQHIPQGRF